MANIQNKTSDIRIAEGLYKEIAALIEQSRKHVALVVNQEITLLYWNIGRAINHSLLKKKRADYGETIIATLSQQLTTSFGKGWGIRHLWHCVRAADIFPENQIVNALSTELSWTHLRELAAIEDDLKRIFYTELTIKERWST